MKTIDEEIRINDQLNPALWNNNELKEDVKERLLDIVDNFLDSLNEDDIKIGVVDVRLLGSNANYNYTDKSDIDLHIVADFSSTPCEQNVMPQLYNAYRSLFSKTYDIKINGYDVELYVEDINAPAKSNGVYSLYTGWISEPKRDEIPQIDWEQFELVFDGMEDRYFDVVGEHSGEIPYDQDELINIFKKEGRDRDDLEQHITTYVDKRKGLEEHFRSNVKLNGSKSYLSLIEATYGVNNKKVLFSNMIKTLFKQSIIEKLMNTEIETLNQLSKDDLGLTTFKPEPFFTNVSNKTGSKENNVLGLIKHHILYPNDTVDMTIQTHTRTHNLINKQLLDEISEKLKGVYEQEYEKLYEENVENDYLSKVYNFALFENCLRLMAAKLKALGIDLYTLKQKYLKQTIQEELDCDEETDLPLCTSDKQNLLDLMGNTLYHCTPRKNLESIYTNGLKNFWFSDTTEDLKDMVNSNFDYKYGGNELVIISFPKSKLDINKVDFTDCNNGDNDVWNGYGYYNGTLNISEENLLKEHLKSEESLLQEGKQDKENFKKWAEQAVEVAYKDRGFSDWERKGNAEYIVNWFEDNRKNLKSPQNDYYYWIKEKNVQAAYDALNRLASEQEKKNNSKKKSKDGAKLIYDDNNWRVYEITTYEASVKYGANTKWCISGSKRWSNGENGRKYWDDYIKEGVKFYFFINNDTKYALALYPNGTDFEIFNAQDNAIAYIPNAPVINEIKVDYYSQNEDKLLLNLVKTGQLPHVCSILSAYLWEHDYPIDIFTKDDFDDFLNMIREGVNEDYVKWLAVHNGLKDEEWYKQETGEEFEDEWWGDTTRYLQYDLYFLDRYATLDDALTKDNPYFDYYNCEYFISDLYDGNIGCCKDWVDVWLYISDYINENDLINFIKRDIRDNLNYEDFEKVGLSKEYLQDLDESLNEHLRSNVNEDLNKEKEIVQSLIDVYGESDKFEKGSSFILPNGKFINLGSDSHMSVDNVISWRLYGCDAGEGNWQIGDFMNKSNAIRVGDGAYIGSNLGYISFSNNITPQQWKALDDFIFYCYSHRLKGVDVELSGYGEYLFKDYENPDDIIKEIKRKHNSLNINEKYANNIDKDILDTIKNPLDKLYKNTKCSKSAGTLLDNYFYETDKPLKLCLGAFIHKGDESKVKDITHVWVELDGKVKETNFPDDDCERVLVDSLDLDRNKDLYNQVKEFLNKPSLREDVYTKDGEYNPDQDSRYKRLLRTPINKLTRDDMLYIYTIHFTRFSGGRNSNGTKSTYWYLGNYDYDFNKALEYNESRYGEEIDKAYEYFSKLTFPLKVYRALRDNEDEISGKSHSLSWTTDINIYKANNSIFRDCDKIVQASITADMVQNEWSIVNYVHYSARPPFGRYPESEITLKPRFKNSKLQDLHFINKDEITEALTTDNYYRYEIFEDGKLVGGLFKGAGELMGLLKLPTETYGKIFHVIGKELPKPDINYEGYDADLVRSAFTEKGVEKFDNILKEISDELKQNNITLVKKKVNPDEDEIIYGDDYQIVYYDDMANVERVDETLDYGYHAGDLGKSEQRERQTGGRNTGHFGTGTYFVGNPDRIKGYNDNQYGKGKAPHHIVDFSSYNLYKPSTNDYGYKLHDALANINNGYKYFTKNAKDYDYFISKGINADKSSDFRIEDIPEIVEHLNNLLGDYDHIDLPTNINFNTIEQEEEDYSDKLYAELKPKYSDTMELFDAIEDEIMKVDKFKAFRQIVKKVRECIEVELTNNIIRKYKEHKNLISQLMTALEYRHSKNQVIQALEEVNKHLDDKTGDSLSTIFMKALGYEGVDVRHLQDDGDWAGLDNTTYGSVIYDIKPETIVEDK